MTTAESTETLRAGDGPAPNPSATLDLAPSAPTPEPPAPVPVLARPVPPAGLDTAEHPPGRVTAGYGLLPPNTDQLAVASAVCGFTAIIPVISQVAGVALGIAGLMRIRRARRLGQPRRGAAWAYAGLVSSGIALAGWIVVVIGFLWVRATVSDVTSELGGIRPGR